MYHKWLLRPRNVKTSHCQHCKWEWIILGMQSSWKLILGTSITSSVRPQRNEIYRNAQLTEQLFCADNARLGCKTKVHSITTGDDSTDACMWTRSLSGSVESLVSCRYGLWPAILFQGFLCRGAFSAGAPPALPQTPADFNRHLCFIIIVVFDAWTAAGHILVRHFQLVLIVFHQVFIMNKWVIDSFLNLWWWLGLTGYRLCLRKDSHRGGVGHFGATCLTLSSFRLNLWLPFKSLHRLWKDGFWIVSTDTEQLCAAAASSGGISTCVAASQRAPRYMVILQVVLTAECPSTQLTLVALTCMHVNVAFQVEAAFGRERAIRALKRAAVGIWASHLLVLGVGASFVHIHLLVGSLHAERRKYCFSDTF